MASIAEHEASMTLFYYKRNGDIYSYATGIQDMKMFGTHADDYTLIMDYIVVERDQMVMEAIHKFYVDIETKQLKLKPEYNLNKYL